MILKFNIKSNFKSLILLLRIDQWSKNICIFLPLFFNGHLFDLELFNNCIVSFMSFSLMASSIYCFNDILDIENDRAHPTKKMRPIASGKIPVCIAYVLMLFCFSISLLLLYLWMGDLKLILISLVLIYFIQNILYCIKLKHYAVIDVVVIAIGFVLRIIVGGAATSILLSEWIIIMTFLLALFLAFAKRRDDVLLFDKTGVMHRKNTNRYNVDLLNQIISILSSVTIIAYIMYTISPEVVERFNCRYVYLTSIFVLISIIRYMQITIVDSNSSNPTKVLFKDHFLQLCIIAWILSFLIIIYL